MANSASKGGVGVTISHQSMSTCPMATLGPPRDPTDTTTWSGGDNWPSTDVYLPNGHIRPPRDPTDTNTWSGGDNWPSTDVYLPNGHIRPSKRSHRYQHMEWG